MKKEKIKLKMKFSAVVNFMRRIIDIIVSLIIIVIFIPIFLIIAILIKIDSHGPILFKQKRIGLGKVPFEILKFRTMIDRKAHEINQIEENIIATNDARVTRLGKYLRGSSLDELPQLFNIFLGDMTFIGPRPVLPEQEEVVPVRYQKRFMVRPGISGLAQVKGRRSLSWEQQLQYDCEYAEKRSFLLDFSIICNTFLVVLLKKDINGGDAKNWRLYREEWKDQ